MCVRVRRSSLYTHARRTWARSCCPVCTWASTAPTDMFGMQRCRSVRRAVKDNTTKTYMTRLCIDRSISDHISAALVGPFSPAAASHWQSFSRSYFFRGCSPNVLPCFFFNWYFQWFFMPVGALSLGNFSLDLVLSMFFPLFLPLIRLRSTLSCSPSSWISPPISRVFRVSGSGRVCFVSYLSCAVRCAQTTPPLSPLAIPFVCIRCKVVAISWGESLRDRNFLVGTCPPTPRMQPERRSLDFFLTVLFYFIFHLIVLGSSPLCCRCRESCPSESCGVCISHSLGRGWGTKRHRPHLQHKYFFTYLARSVYALAGITHTEICEKNWVKDAGAMWRKYCLTLSNQMTWVCVTT